MVTISQMIYIQVHFHELKVLYFDSDFTEVCSQGSDWQKGSIGSGNGLVLNRLQAITNVDPVHWQWLIYAVLGGDDLMIMSLN